MKFERGGFVLGLVVGLLVGLSVALGVALYITKAPIPFINKVPPRTAEQDSAEAERNRNWNPNAPLSGRTMPRPATTGASGAAPAEAPAATPAAPAPGSAPTAGRDPAALLSGAPVPAASQPGATAAAGFVFFVQVGAFANPAEAEQQRARVAMSGLAARISEREQAGRTVHRVRIGPYDKREDAEAAQARLGEQGFEARLVRVER